MQRFEPAPPRVDDRVRDTDNTAGADARLLHATYTLVLAGGRGQRLQQLTATRAKPALPFGGKFQIIDFALSNCINSGLRRIGVLTQYKSQGLIRHLTRGWGFLDAGLGEFLDVVPAQQRIDAGWYSGTADAVWQSLDILREAGPRQVLVLAGDHVYKMDYSRMLADHRRLGAPVTVACCEVPIAQASAFGVLQIDASQHVTGFAEKPQQPAELPGRPGWALASMGVYVFEAEVLYAELARDAADAASQHDFGHDLLPAAVARGRVAAHLFADSCVNRTGDRPYWRDVGTLDSYWEANMDLTRVRPELDLYDDAWPIRSLQHQLPPAKFVFDVDDCRGMAVDSIVSSGCIVSGATVRRSVLFSKSRVGQGSLVEDSLLLPNVVVGRDVVVRRAIIDKHCVLPDGLRVGVDPARDRERFCVSEAGITLVTPDTLGQGGHSRV